MLVVLSVLLLLSYCWCCVALGMTPIWKKRLVLMINEQPMYMMFELGVSLMVSF